MQIIVNLGMLNLDIRYGHFRMIQISSVGTFESEKMNNTKVLTSGLPESLTTGDPVRLIRLEPPGVF